MKKIIAISLMASSLMFGASNVNNNDLYSVKAVNYSCKVIYAPEDDIEIPRKNDDIYDAGYVNTLNGLYKSIFGNVTQSMITNKTMTTKKDIELGNVEMSFIKFWRFVYQNKTPQEYRDARATFLSTVLFTKGEIANTKDYGLIEQNLRKLNFKQPEKAPMMIDEILNPDMQRYNQAYFFMHGKYLLKDIISNPKNKENIENPKFKELVSLIVDEDFQSAYKLLKSDSYFTNNLFSLIDTCMFSEISLNKLGK